MPPESLHTDETALLLRIAEGDEQAFSSLFTTWATPLAAIAMRILKNEYARQEVVQEVFIKVWLHRDKLDKVENLGAWLRKITVNQSLLALQRHAANDKRLEAIQITQNPVDNTSTLELKEIRRLVHETIESLPPQRKIIYQLNRVEGKTTREIAEELQLSHGYVRNALSAALAIIRERLTGSGLLLLALLLHL
ncbi:sigma-70 family RNA polymerase sigma factor [Chitinophaga sp.]|uniref:sigma-70 family RNA polymerase sigma factor n=1 Tax=Chitinophaga sp. TaxID=1869181 RepID=UPI002BCA0194|nr:sigma-70 family RNA polymerase sigma factor [Chitinophaga sp.]HWV68894.1 sigma-70 family RNA polymerase sigma factor [Chitinophaga sp.]